VTSESAEQSGKNKSPAPNSGSPAANEKSPKKYFRKLKFLLLKIIGKRKKAEKVAAAAKQPGKPAKRSQKSHNPVIVFANFIFMLATFCIVVGTAALYEGKSIFTRPGISPQPQTISVPSGSGIHSIADLLEKRRLISNPKLFVYGSQWEGKAGLLKAGEYEIPAYASMQDIIDILVQGHSVEYSITFPEGLTVEQIFAKLRETPLLTGSLPQNLPPEGSLMTDTVKFARGTARKALVARLQNNQEHLVQEIWANRAPNLPLKTPEDMVILASIVEKETGIASERPHIAAVFYNRLRKNMRLQSDPTVLYGLFGGKGRPADRPIYRSDLDKVTPYNTYKIMGLPPTPICNPGKDSLLAVAHPQQSDDLYFVADGSGGHVFSQTLSEHNNNVSKWRAWRKAQESQNKTAPANAKKADNGDSAVDNAQSGNNLGFQPLPYSASPLPLPLMQNQKDIFEQDGLIKEKP